MFEVIIASFAIAISVVVAIVSLARDLEEIIKVDEEDQTDA